MTSTGAGGAASVVNGTLNVAAGTLQINRTGGTGDAGSGDFLVTGLTGSGTITNGANTERWLFVNGTGAFGGTLANGGGTGGLGFNKQGTGIFTLTGSNSFSGATTVSGGTLSIVGTNSLGGPVNLNGSAALPSILNLQNSNALGTSVVTSTNRNSGIQLQGGITLPSTVSFITSNDGTSGATVPYAIGNVSGNNTINGTISLTVGGGPSIIQSDSGSLTLAGNITIATGQTSRGIILQGTSTGANTFSGALSDLSVTSLASITKNGTGTWTVSGANNPYSGVTAVNEGTLVISGNITGATNVTVAANATLAGNGNLGGNVTVAANGIHSLAVGANPGVQVKRTIAGTLTLAAGNILNLTGTPEPGVYIIATANGGITGTPTTVIFNGIPGSVSVSGDGKDLVLTVSVAGTYASWAATNAGGQASTLDFDNDGMKNGVEYFMGATGSTFTPNPGIVGGKITWPKDPGFSGNYTVQTSTNLVNWTDVPSNNLGNAVEYVVPASPSPLFVRLDVKPN